jgi:SAM-dependent methyltransferase
MQLYIVGKERLTCSVSSFLDSAHLVAPGRLDLLGWLTGARRGRLHAQVLDRSLPMDIVERPDVCLAFKTDSRSTFGFRVNSELLPPGNVFPLEIWSDNVPLTRIFLSGDKDASPDYATPALTPPSDLVDAIGDGDFHSIGREFLDYFRLLAGLRPGDRVLDIGCGSGRIALQLTQYLNPQGSYAGFDVNPAVVQWCQENITPAHPNFRFEYRPLFNSLYNRNAGQSAAAVNFPYPDSSFDFVLATSVFTHLLKDDCMHYLRETARVLKPGGRSVHTFFLLNEESEQLLADRKMSLAFDVKGEDVSRFNNSEVPEYAVAYSEAFVRNDYAASGLRILDPIYYGGWVGRPAYLSYQDMVISEKL